MSNNFFFSDLEGKNYSYTDNKFLYRDGRGTEDKSTNILYSVPISSSPTDRCLKYRFLLVGSVYLTVSYLTDFNDLYLDVPIAAHASFESQHFTHGYTSLPLLKEFKVC